MIGYARRALGSYAVRALSLALGVLATAMFVTVRESREPDKKVRAQMTRTSNECARLANSLRVRSGVRSPMQPDIPCAKA